MKTFTRESRIARMLSTTSSPCSRGGSKSSAACSRSRNASVGFSQIPIVRSPCTLECPRTGHTPAPGLPIIPRSRTVLTISWIVATELRCCVSPIAQHTIVRCEPAIRSVSASTSASVRPVVAATSISGPRSRCARSSSKPPQCRAMNS
jgi:hypothetical protein